MSRRAPSLRDILLGHLASVFAAALLICGLAALAVSAVRHLVAM